MTKAKLTIEQPGSDPVEIDVEVTEGMEPVVIFVTSRDVQVHTETEPKVVTVQ